MSRETETKFLFVGENPSNTAKLRGWTWESGRLAAKQLFDALIDNGINPESQIFINLFSSDWKIRNRTIDLIDAGILEGLTVVAMGSKVQRKLKERNIEHIEIVHPAARGIIRKKENYSNHIRDKLL